MTETVKPGSDRGPLWGAAPEMDAPPEKADVLVLPLPAEPTVSYGTGTSRAPEAIIAASAYVELFDEELLLDLTPIRVATLEAPAGIEQADSASLPTLIREAVRRLPVERAMLLGLGGEHSVTLGLVAGILEHFPKAGLLQIDAHLDLRSEYAGDPFSHACVVRRLHEELGLSVTNVGARAFCAEEWAYAQEHGIRVFPAHRLPAGDYSWVERVVEGLPEEVYLTLDVDGLDPAVLPGTGTPEPGGLDFRQITALLRALFARRKVIGADIVETVPLPSGILSEYTAARLAMKMMAYRRAERENS
jgi:agmatinase